MLVLSMMFSIVFCGGMVPVSGGPILDQLSWARPARGDFAANHRPDHRRTVVTSHQLVATQHDHAHRAHNQPDRQHPLAQPAMPAKPNLPRHKHLPKPTLPIDTALARRNPHT
jgi:hypothetical protein